MIAIDNMHQGYIFRVCSVASCCSVLQVPLMLFTLFACFNSYIFLRVRRQEGEYVHAVLCCCSCPLCVCVRGLGLT